MSENIIERLRQLEMSDEVKLDAADEIERLQGEIATYRQALVNICKNPWDRDTMRSTARIALALGKNPGN